MNTTSSTRLCLIAMVIASCFGQVFSQTNSRWVFAPSGLNLRANENPSSSKLTKVEFGEQVVLLEAENGPTLTVDQLEAPMVQVQYGAETGYMFAGYLSRFPPPEKKPDELNKTQTYVYELQAKGFDIYYESHFYENNGPSSEEDVFYLPKATWEEAFLIAWNLYELPKSILFPKVSKLEEEVIPNPKKYRYAHEDELLVKRGKKGELLSLSYTLTTEGYYNVTIEYDASSDSMKITSASAAC